MRTRLRSLTTLGILAAGLTLAAPMHGAESKALHTNRLTFSGAVRLPGVTLAAGSYIFERVDPTIRDVIVVRSGDRLHTYFMAMTQPADRPTSLSADHLVSFGEHRRGEVPPIAAWYPAGEHTGHAFVYNR